MYSAADPTVPSTPLPLSGRTVVFLHAHPDDEAIFTGVTMHRLARAGARVVLVTATAGELGPVLRPLRAGETLADRRRVELERSCAALGVARLVLLGHRDSGMSGWDANLHPDALAGVDLAAASRRLAELCAAEGAEALVHYDSDGIYRHPDHVAVHRIGTAAAALAQVPGYQATVDRDHLSGRGRHLVEVAAASGANGRRAGPNSRGAGPNDHRADPNDHRAGPNGRHRDLNGSPNGRNGTPNGHSGGSNGHPSGPNGGPGGGPGVGRLAGQIAGQIGTVVRASAADLAAKRAAMAAHASQIPPAALRRRDFAQTYGLEWYVRTGPAGLLDALSARSAVLA